MKDEEEEDKGFVDGMLGSIFYTPPFWVIKYRIYLFLIIIAFVLIISGIFFIMNYINITPIQNYNTILANDQKIAYNIAITDPSLQSNVENQNGQLETLSNKYIYLQNQTFVNYPDRSNFMSVNLQVWDMPTEQELKSGSGALDTQVYNYYFIVDIKNNTIIQNNSVKVA